MNNYKAKVIVFVFKWLPEDKTFITRNYVRKTSKKQNAEIPIVYLTARQKKFDVVTCILVIFFLT